MMPLTTVIHAFGIFSTLGIQDIRLTGGEPTIHPQFDVIVAKALDHGFRVGLVTNGVRLLKMPKPEGVLMRLSRCWVSAYGPSEEIHTHISKCLAPSLGTLIKRIGTFTQTGYAVGLSVLLTPGSTSAVPELLNRASSAGIRRLRFIPVQPDGRGADRLSYDWSTWPQELPKLYKTLRNDPLTKRFEVLTLNDVFDFASRFPREVASCLLHHRRMWSVVPNGDIYPCCFTAYETKRKLGNIMNKGIVDQLQAKFTASDENPPCRAFDDSFWPGIPQGSGTCPISNISLKTKWETQATH